MSHPERKLLPTNLKPISYEVRLEPCFEEQSFSGQVDISCDVVAATRSIQLHCKFISITRAAAVAVSERGIHKWDLGESITYDHPRETVELAIGEELSAGTNIKISLRYNGKFKNDLAGFYQAHYTTEDGSEHSVAVTSMEPTYARQLVALISGPLGQVGSSKSRFPLSLYCPIGSEGEARFALDLAWNGLQLFEVLFDSLYPLPKLDLVAVPDFAAGAMENWGVIIFRTNALLMDPDDTALDRKQYITETILHEISHMWFGNLVTMRYWDGLWLKEGFATLMAWFAANRFFPSWRIWDSYVFKELQLALELDSLKTSHPVELVVKDATEAKQIFDDISYKKGCCVLKMISNEMGEERFWEGVKLYIHRHKFRNAESADLWRALEESTGESFSARMQVWTKEPGFPIITVKEEFASTNKGADEPIALSLRQERFIASGMDQGGNTQQVYPLRIAIRSESGVDRFEMATRDLTIPTHGKKILKVNADHDGFFRTSYSPEHLQKLIRAASEQILSLRDCIGLSCDLKSLVAAGINKTSELLNLSLGFRTLDSYYVWELIDQNLRSISLTWKFQDRSLREAMRKVTVDIIGLKAHSLGWKISEADDDTTISFKASMFSGAGLAGDQIIIEEAKKVFTERLAGNEKAISPHLRWEVFGIVAAHGGKEELEALFRIWKTSSNEDEKYLALECMGRASTAELVRWVLGLAFTKDVKDQDLYILLWLVGSSPHGAIELWEWTKRNWDRVEKAVPVDVQCMTLGVILDGLGTLDQIADVESYFAARDTRNYRQLLDQKLEKMDIRRRWAERDASNLESWLERNGYLEAT